VDLPSGLQERPGSSARCGQGGSSLGCSTLTAAVGRHGLETSDRLGRHRWIIEHSLAWLTGYRRLTLRYERSARLFTESLTLTATLIRGDKKLTTRDKLLVGVS
jgi:hypothetical protein